LTQKCALTHDLIPIQPNLCFSGTRPFFCLKFSLEKLFVVDENTCNFWCICYQRLRIIFLFWLL
jgi:hypothetical protein